MKKHLSTFLAVLAGILTLWVIVLLTPLSDFLALTGWLNLPVPEHAAGPPVDPEKGYHLEEVGDGVYFLSGWSHNTMFVVTSEGVVAVDAPPSIGDAYLDAIREVTDKPVTHVIYSHNHDDHIGSADIFAGATFIAHADTADILADKGDLSRPVPTVTFQETHTLALGGKVIELGYHGAAHCSGNIVIYLPQDKVLAAIDIAFPRWVPIHEFAIAEDIDAYFTIYDALLSYDFDLYIGGHNNTGTRQDVIDQRDYAGDVRTAAREAYASVGIAELGERAAASSNTWVTLSFGLDRLSSRCAEQVVGTWGEKLAGADVFTHSHCKRMVFHAMTE